MEGRAGEVQTGAFLIALRAKGETVAELVGLARTMRNLAAHVNVNRDDLVDTAGTGGGPTTFNISTTAALIAAGAGCAVAKHGNRSATSRCGSADLLEALGVQIELTPEQVATCIEEIGFGFMFAPKHHQAMAHVVPVRKELAVRTIFNLLGPADEPGGCAGASSSASRTGRFQETIAEALLSLGCDHAMVVSADDGLDELSIADRTRVVEVADGRHGRVVRRGGGPRPRDRAAGDHRRRRPGRRTPASPGRSSTGEQGPQREVALLNAGAAIFVGGSCREPRRRRRAGPPSGGLRRRLGMSLTRLIDRSRELAGAS